MFNKRLLSGIILLCIAVPVRSAPTQFVVPTQKITGAEEPVSVGDIVFLSLSPVDIPPKYLVNTSVQWQAYDNCNCKKNVHISSDGTLVFAAGLTPKSINVIAAVAYSYAVPSSDNKSISESGTLLRMYNAVVNVVGVNPVPPNPNPVPPGPNPAPPDPIFPDGTYKLSGLVWRLARDTVADTTTRVNGAAALASSIRGIASAIDAGTITDLGDGLAKTAAANASALGGNKSAWDSWGTQLQKYLFSLYKSKTLNTAADLSVAWKEVALGLDKVR